MHSKSEDLLEISQEQGEGPGEHMDEQSGDDFLGTDSIVSHIHVPSYKEGHVLVATRGL